MQGTEPIAATRASPPPPTARIEFRQRAADWAVLLLAAGLAVVWCGHFSKPHGDFFEFREMGRDLLAGRVPETTKRGPVFPVLINVAERVGELIAPWLHFDRPAARWATEWLNAALLPLNAWLFIVVARRWCGAAAPWWACWFVLLPISAYCHSHALVEPLLVCLWLATLALIQRESDWAWLTAALAAITRFDLAGLILGVLLVRAGRRDKWHKAALAGLPLLGWLWLTWATWGTRAADHYLRQIFAPREGWTWTNVDVIALLFPVEALRLPVWAADLQAPLRATLGLALPVLCAVGIVACLLRRERAAIVAIVGGVGYLLVHGVFPFQIERFGYPLTPLALMFAAAGASYLSNALQSRAAELRIGRLASAALLLVIAGAGLAFWAELGDLQQLLAARPAWSRAVPLLSIGGALAVAVLVSISAFKPSPPDTIRSRFSAWPRAVVAIALLLTVACSQALAVLPLMGDGDEMRGLIAAARFVRDKTGPDELVLSGASGLLRLYCGDEPSGRFRTFSEIQARAWPEILRECRARDVRYILWHDQMLEEQGGYYIAQWGLQRFESLSSAAPPAGLTLIREFSDPPHARIFSLAPAGTSSAGASRDTVPGLAESSLPSPRQTYP